MGKIVRVDLGTKEIKIEDIATEDEEKYIGGAGVAAAIFTREVPANIDPFDDKNLLIFSVGPFCGTAIPFCGRHFRSLAPTDGAGVPAGSSARPHWYNDRPIIPLYRYPFQCGLSRS